MGYTCREGGKMNELEVIKLGFKLLKEHGLDLEYNFKLDDAKCRFGSCNITDKVISVSKHLAALNSLEQVTDTIKHEIAHALEYKKFGRLSHSGTWKALAMTVGCVAERCYDSKEVATPELPKYVYKCINCGHEITKTYKMYRFRACKRCCDKYNGGKFSSKYIFELKEK